MNAYTEKLNVTLYGLLRWDDWGTLIARLKQDDINHWYLSAAGTHAPETPVAPSALHVFLNEMDTLLRNQHDEDYLGIVYVDNIDSPTLIKIYDPNNLGSACGSSGMKIDPGWVISLDAPSAALGAESIVPGNRRRWWESLQQKFLAVSQ